MMTEVVAIRRFSRLTLAAAAGTYLLIVLGGLVRATGAGLACPDWPLCQGQLIPPFEPLVLIEWSHRLVASVVGFLTLAVAVMAWRRFRDRREFTWTATLALALVVVQIALGGLTVRFELSPWLVVAHLGIAMAFFATLIMLAATALLGGGEAHRDRFWTLALLTVLTTYLLILVGGYVSASGAGLACPDWPLCYGQLVPSLQGLVGVHFLHRLAAAVVGLLILGTAAAAYRTQGHRPLILAASAIAVGLLALQVILGALNIEYQLADSVTTAHLATAAALFATLVALVVLADRFPAGDALPLIRTAGLEPRPRVQRVLDYVALTKPRIIILLLVTAFAAMLVAAPGTVSPWIILATLVGGAMSAGSANAINQLLERDIDALMTRTRRRPIPSGRVEPPFAFAFAVLLGMSAFALLAAAVNLLSAVLATIALLFYVFVYTVWLKRSTPQNIVIGGAAGAMPPLVGWAAATGRVEIPALILFLIIFLWTPPHFWALALFRRDDYARAHIPMLPVVAGDDETRRQILIYTVVLVAATLLLYPLGGMGWLYVISAAALGAMFISLAVRVRSQRTHKAAVQLFSYSMVYLALLFAAMVADRLLG